MQRAAAASSNVRAVGYDEVASVLEVELHNGGMYQYAPVSLEEYEDFITAESVGRALLRFKSSQYRCTHVYPCCSEPFDSTVVRHVCSTIEAI